MGARANPWDVSDEQTETPLELAERIGDAYGLVPGARADLQLYRAGTWPDALADQDPPTHVWRAGRLVATTEVTRRLRPGRSGISPGWSGRAVRPR